MAHATVILLALLAGSDVDADERVAIFPGYGYRAVDSDQWRVYTHGVVYEPEEDSATRRLAYRLLRDRLALKPDSSEARRLRRRVTQIFVDHESGQLISIRPGDVESNVVTLGPTGDDGHFQGEFVLPAEGAATLLSHTRQPWLDISVVLPPDDHRRMAGRSQLISREGLSIVSDIDDTLLHTGIGNPTTVLRNAFLEPLRPIEGMAALYRHAERRGVVFHYVTNSPSQLYQSLIDFLRENRFPAGSLHPRPMRWLDTERLAEVLVEPEHKRATIGRLLAAFPQRRFVLIGDSHGADPSVYGDMARDYPDQVVGVWIRVDAGQAATDRSLRRAGRGIPPDCWHPFRQPDELETPLGELFDPPSNRGSTPD